MIFICLTLDVQVSLFIKISTEIGAVSAFVLVVTTFQTFLFYLQPFEVWPYIRQFLQ